jgi:choline dehydrogenase
MSEEYAVVVVGAGAAGCVVAARIAAAGYAVLLLEAGPDRRSDAPDEIRNGWGITRQFDWGYTSRPDRNGSVRNVWRNKLVGGTSWVTRFTPRGHPADYDGWAALGNLGWGFDDVLPCFKRLETDTDFGDRLWHGDHGPMPSTRYLDLDYTEIAAAAIEALEAAGFPSVDDHNEPGAVGVGRMPMNTRDGVRVTTADAYLAVGQTPPNLTIRADVQVADIVFDGAEARGVRLADGTVVHAGHVVVCAGTYGSPVLLMRSGLGPADHLRAVGVPVGVDLPGVGANLADHPSLFLDFGYGGPGRSVPVLHSIATFHSTGRFPSDTPDLMFWLCDPDAADDPPGFGFEVVLLRPLSRGSVRLRSAAAADPPMIELPSLTEASDVERLAEAYARGLEIASAPEIRRLCDKPLASVANGKPLSELVRAEVYSLPHVVGTCAMGPRPEDGAVVDADGQVHGTARLYIVDASVMPDVPSGFTHVPTIMLAERLSERIASLL